MAGWFSWIDLIKKMLHLYNFPRLNHSTDEEVLSNRIEYGEQVIPSREGPYSANEIALKKCKDKKEQRS